eukprot:4947043-Amphidinium_carterae.1
MKKDNPKQRAVTCILLEVCRHAGPMTTAADLLTSAHELRLALLVVWSTRGGLESTAACEMLLMPTDQFIKVTTSFPVTAAVVSSYAMRTVEVGNASA